jgi:Zn-dependent protease
MIDNQVLQFILVGAIPLLFAITLHEVGHGYMAYLLGDPTAKLLGRLSLNPIRHVDMVGTVILPFSMLLISALAGTSPMIFGWAKPVPVDARNFKNLRRDEALVSAAGPGANFIMAIFWALLLNLGISMQHDGTMLGRGLSDMAQYGIIINLFLMVLNLLPIPPLDGGHLVSASLPPRLALNYNRLAPYGIPILLILFVTGILFAILGPVIDGLFTLILNLFVR